jgi:F420-dependent oxidoreductase-like protein
VQLGATIGFRGDTARLISETRSMESAGVQHFWTGEAYTADGVSLMGFLAAVTRTATIGSSILPIYTRTPTLLAMTAIGIDNLSGGRCILGLGASGPQVIEGFHGLGYDFPLARTREIIDICRQVFRGEKVVHDGERYQIPLRAGRGTGLGKPLRVMGRTLRPDIPIYVASLGPKNVEMTAEVADGWLPIHFWPERVDMWHESIESGLAKRSADLGPLQIVAGGALAITEDYEELRERERGTLGFFFGGMGARGRNFYNDLLKRYGFEEVAQKIQDAWFSEGGKAAAALVPDEILEATTLVGPESWVKERVQAFEQAGVTILNTQPVGANKLADLEKVRSWLS